MNRLKMTTEKVFESKSSKMSSTVGSGISQGTLRSRSSIIRLRRKTTPGPVEDPLAGVMGHRFRTIAHLTDPLWGCKFGINDNNCYCEILYNKHKKKHIGKAMFLRGVTLSNKKWAEFFDTELVWPNSKPSGIKPAMLALPPSFKGVPVVGDTNKDRPLTFCENALNPKKPSRPDSLPPNVLIVQSDPPKVDIDDVEEFLVHDALFVEFFNAFLALPAFPEPICFNVETGGFEVVSDGRQTLAKQIKEAVRSQNFTPKMYRLARHHAFSDMPLIPIEDVEGPEGVKIDTTYNVTVLNKDQGIYWIKAERLPIFLESDFYFEYRLAKVISQARLFNDEKEFVVMKIDFTPRQKKVKKSVEVPPPNIEDVIVKQMYVSFGDVKGAAKEAWFTQAKEGISTNPKFTTLSPQMSSEVFKEGQSEHDRLKSSVFSSPYFGVYAPGLVGPGENCPPIENDMLNNEMFHKVDDRPFTPRPSEKIHVSTRTAEKDVTNSEETSEQTVKPGHVVFLLPQQDNRNTDSESGIGEMDEKDEELERRMIMQPIIDGLFNDESWEVTPSIALKSVSDFGSVIVGAVMKKTLADLLSVSEKIVLEDPKISGIYPSEELNCITVNDLDKCYVLEEVDSSKEEDLLQNISFKPKHALKQKKDSKNSSSKDSDSQSHRWNREIKKSAEEESDTDSLLDSDEDFEEQDIYFRRKKDKWHNLTSMKGIVHFKKFLAGTPGEKYWELWVDIDKGRLLRDEEDEQNYSVYMRGKYHKQGSPFELSKEDKRKLGLESPGRWCTEYLFQIQGKVMEPLVLYWAPRYLLKHLLQTDPDRYCMYSAMKSYQPQKESDPFPMTKSLLPLRPKSCCPRTRHGQGVEEKSALKNRLNMIKANEAEFVTSPKVGNHRIYGDDTVRRLAKTPTAKYLGIQPPPEIEPKPPITSYIRPQTASSQHSSIVREESNIHSSRSKNGSIHSSVSGSVDKKSKPKSSRSSVRKSENTFVGKLPGIGSKNRFVASAGPLKSKAKEEENFAGGKSRCRCKSASVVSEAKKQKTLTLSDRRDSKDSGLSEKPPCPLKDFGDILGQSFAEYTTAGEILSPVKKPRDLLSPKLRILDTKQQRSRQSSAVHRIESKASEKITFYRQESMDSSKVCDSRPTSGSKDDFGTMKVADMTDCNFMGSERMEMLLQALHHDKEAGRAFWKFMEKDEDNQVALNCFDFWDNVQEYRKLFYKEKLDLFFINKQAKVIFAQFIVSGAPKSIEVSDSIELQIMEKLKPAYEDLYDEAEEHALKILFEEFLEFLSQDVKSYCKVERSEISRRLETKNTYILNLQKKGIIKERPLTPDDPMEGYVDPVYDESVLERIPEEFRDWTFDKLVHSRIELEHFRQYLAENYAEIDLKCWMDMEAWRRTPPTEPRKRDQRARDVKKLYLNKKYFFGPSSPAGKEGQDKVMEAAGGWGKFLEDKPHHDAILEAQKYVAERLEKKHLPLFLLTKEFQERQTPKITSDDIADDVVVQKKRRSQAVLKVREIWSEGQKSFYNLLRKERPPLLFQPVTRLLPPINQKCGGSLISQSQEELIRRSSAETKPNVLSTNENKSQESVSVSNSQISDNVLPNLVESNILPIIGSVESDRNKLSSMISDYAQTSGSLDSNLEATPSVESGIKENIKASESLESSVATTVSVEPFIKDKIKASKSLESSVATTVSVEPFIKDKLLESKWVSSTKEIYIFKQALKNPVTCRQFQKYVSIKGDNLENDLLFWLEIQRYKQMHHLHTEDSMLMQKINAVIQCFIDSSIPPSLQIDIPQDMADRILDHKHEKGPYLFREAQLATFRILLTHWIPFCEFRNNMGSDERAMKTLDRHRIASQQRELRYQEELERERLREKMALEDIDQLPDELREDEDDKGKISFSYSSYLSQEVTAHATTLYDEDGTQTIRSMLDKSVDTSSKLGSDEKLTSKEEKLSRNEDELLINRRLSTTSDKKSEQSGLGKRKCTTPEEREEQVKQLMS